MLKVISNELAINTTSVQSVIQLLESGATIPFIARYRKERTNGLDENQIRAIQQRHNYYNELNDRKVTVLKTIEELEKLTPDLKKAIDDCLDKQQLEDLYLPYKPRRKTKADAAREKGLQPLANWILLQQRTNESRESILKKYMDTEKGVVTSEDALFGALDIIRQHIADMASIRDEIRRHCQYQALLQSKVTKKFHDQKTKYEMYYEFSEKLEKAASHRILAIRRGEKEGVLKWALKIDDEKMCDGIDRRIIRSQSFMFFEELKATIRLAYNELIFTSIQTECFQAKCEEAEANSIQVFSENLKNLLLAAPAGPKCMLGLDPGFRTGCKVAAIDTTGKFLENTTIYPVEPQKKVAESKKILISLIQKYDIKLITIGNGTASKETMQFVKQMIKSNQLEVTPVIVNESGASVYSASELAGQEFPDLDLTVRGAISIARRLQDPLAELVKIDPKAIGVGQYQHDVNQPKLKDSLGFTTESCVNHVGVDLNTASAALLTFVAGIGPALANNIVAYRDQNGPFAERKILLKVPKLGAKAFEQCAGFLRIKNGKNPLDNSAIHPESYSLVKQIAKDQKIALDKLIGNSDKLRAIDFKTYITPEVGLLTLKDIQKELEKPGLDPREEFTYAKFADDINDISDLKEDLELEGVVTNVTNFGAFVDIGVHQDGLIHISKLSNTFVKNPHDEISVGENVIVKVIKVDTELKRIQLQRIMS